KFQRLETQPLFAADRNDLDQFVLRRFVLATAAVSRIDERMKAGLGDKSRPSAGDVAHQLRHDSLGQDVGFKLVGERHLHEDRRVDERAGDAALEHTFVAETRGAFLLPVADADDMNERKVARRRLAEKSGFNRFQNGFWHAMPAARPAYQNTRA